MQNVSLQMMKSMKRRDDLEIEAIILHSSWRFIGIKTFFFLVRLLWRIPLSVKRFKPDVILFSSMVTSGVLPAMIRKPTVPCVTINHGQDVTLPNPIYQWYVPKIFKNLSGVISVSSATRQASIDRGMPPDKGRALFNGFDASSDRIQPEKPAARRMLEKEFGINLAESKILLTVGRHVKRKGHEWFIREAFGRIQSDVVYIIVGDGPELDNIILAKEQCGRGEKIVLTGRLPIEMLQVCYAAADIFIMPNIPVEGDMEGFGIVLLEANKSGVPAVASDLEGIKDVIKQGVNGYRLPHGNAEAFAEKIDEILAGELKRLSKTSREYVMNTFTWDAVVENYVSFLRSVNE
ncbi:MAG: glycosyltransferase family 4 protein [Balneolaceae bacterium]|nr:MAG: glycosyltransferase family 4 protein [Balneolaceae bacterium]